MVVKPWIAFLVVAVLAGGTVFSVVRLSSLQNELREARNEADAAAAAESSAADALSQTESELSNVRRDLRELKAEQEQAAQAQSLDEQLQSGTAQPADGLIAEVSNFDCFSRTCNAVEGTATFINKTNTGSSVTCVFEVDYEDGQRSHFTWYSEYVPPKDETVTDLYYSSVYESPIDYWYDSDECYRGVATWDPATGDI